MHRKLEAHSLIELAFLISNEGLRDEIAQHSRTEARRTSAVIAICVLFVRCMDSLKACKEWRATFSAVMYLALLSIGAIPHKLAGYYFNSAGCSIFFACMRENLVTASPKAIRLAARVTLTYLMKDGLL